MKLTFNQIKSITQGAAEIVQNDGNVVFNRFNKDERDVYSQTEFCEKTASTSGVQMEFETDGDCLNLQIKTSEASSRTFFSMDIFVNGNCVSCIKNFDDTAKSSNYVSAKFKMGSFQKNVELGSGSKTVRIVFPWSVAAELVSIELEYATYVTPVSKNKSMFIYGDSIATGYDAMYSSASMSSQLANALNVELFNKSIGGEIFRPELAKIKSDVAPSYILVAYGTNEFSRSEQSDFCQRCQIFFDSLVCNYPEVPIFALTPIWRSDYDGERIFGKFEDVENNIRKICSAHKNITVISAWDFVPHNQKYFSDLRLHPNDEGCEHYYNNLTEEIKKMISCCQAK